MTAKENTAKRAVSPPETSGLIPAFDASTVDTQEVVNTSSVKKSNDAPDVDYDGYADPQDISDDAYNSGAHTIHFKDLENVICEHYSSLREAPHDSNVTRAESNAFYRAEWQKLRKKTAEDVKVPNALFDAPRSSIQVVVIGGPSAEGQHYCCPCDFETEAELAKIQIRVAPWSAQGITKDVFLKQLCEGLFGTAGNGNVEGRVFDPKNNKLAMVGDDGDRPVINNFTYMMTRKGESSERSILGDIYIMTTGMVPRVVEQRDSEIDGQGTYDASSADEETELVAAVANL